MNRDPSVILCSSRELRNSEVKRDACEIAVRYPVPVATSTYPLLVILDPRSCLPPSRPGEKRKLATTVPPITHIQPICLVLRATAIITALNCSSCRRPITVPPNNSLSRTASDLHVGKSQVLRSSLTESAKAPRTTENL